MTQEPAPGVLRLLAAVFYDLILLFGLLLLATTLVVVPLDIGLDSTALEGSLLFQLYLVAVIALFYGWFWSRGGQTLGMRTWKLKILTRSGETLSLPRALLRLLLAIVTLAPAGLGWWWKFVDRDSQTLYDRLCGCRMIRLELRSI
jgi:uncharacterized RDD family membrane protein YckC